MKAEEHKGEGGGGGDQLVLAQVVGWFSLPFQLYDCFPFQIWRHGGFPSVFIIFWNIFFYQLLKKSSKIVAKNKYLPVRIVNKNYNKQTFYFLSFKLTQNEARPRCVRRTRTRRTRGPAGSSLKSQP
jgi:hypothetical protein